MPSSLYSWPNLFSRLARSRSVDRAWHESARGSERETTRRVGSVADYSTPQDSRNHAESTLRLIARQIGLERFRSGSVGLLSAYRPLVGGVFGSSRRQAEAGSGLWHLKTERRLSAHAGLMRPLVSTGRQHALCMVLHRQPPVRGWTRRPVSRDPAPWL